MTDVLSLRNSTNSLFTYKVMFDGGTAPNPFHKTCTLAICKPVIRRTAEVGDIVVGLAPGNDGRIVYVMVVDKKIPWAAYIQECSNPSSALHKKIPKSPTDQGDCIWKSAPTYVGVLPSHSGHGEDDFNHDVTNGVNVLLSVNFWYFGEGDTHELYLNDALKPMIPGRGHKSKINEKYKEYFVEFFNNFLTEEKIIHCGIHGTPKHAPSNEGKITCIPSCRQQQRDNESEGEEDDTTPTITCPNKKC